LKGSNLKERGIESIVEGNRKMKDWEGKKVKSGIL
jgi:hypothetical protein